MRDAVARSVFEALFAFDQKAAEVSGACLAGIDEAGRGPLAGPVVAAAAILRRGVTLQGLNDSKKVPPPLREKLYWLIVKHAFVGIGIVHENMIDSINIFQATRLAMKMAVLALPKTPEHLLIDGNMKLDLPLKQKAIVKGDQKSAAIAAASIVAKVYRDAWMRHLDTLYPAYFFARHKGYATAVHLEAMREYGLSPVHRRSYEPVRRISEEQFEKELS
ncbi:MAG: ribonuclease HII [Omnitrophica bacterium GWA2_52_8]|nr:MAG: ribonuclease HII [Omnitrophica bacterium GWA2_52_8]